MERDASTFFKHAFAFAVVLIASIGATAQTTTRAAGSTDAEEQAMRPGRWIRTIQSDLINEEFDELDQMATEYRQSKSRVPGGEWRLRLFYMAIDAPQQTDKDTLDHLAHLEHWMRLRPASITARVALATSLHRWAWVARGNGLANTVTGGLAALRRAHSGVADGARWLGRYESDVSTVVLRDDDSGACSGLGQLADQSSIRSRAYNLSPITITSIFSMRTTYYRNGKENLELPQASPNVCRQSRR